jgi:hypothetical protein
MNSDNSPKSKEAWTVVGQKKKGGAPQDPSDGKYLTPHQALKAKPIDDLTPEDVYYANLNATPVERPDVSAYLMNTIVDQTKDMTPQESLDALGNVATFVVESMVSILKNATSKILDINDDQKTVIALNGYLENIADTRSNIGIAIDVYDENVSIMNSLKKTSIENIQKFLTACGIDEIPSYRAKKGGKIDTPDNVYVDSLPVENIRRSYASAIGAASSDLVVEKQPVNIVNNITQPRTLMVDTGIVDVNMPVVSNIQDTIGFTLSYLDYCKVSVIRMGNNVFTAGPGNFVNLKNSNGKTKHAKRCLNPQPCRYKNCKYYHDPCVVYEDFNDERNFALSYVLQMLSAVKDNTDLLENKSVRDPNFVRDLVQLGGIILIKAAQIKALHFAGKTI